jgi:hypothetical protein
MFNQQDAKIAPNGFAFLGLRLIFGAIPGL